MDQWGKIPEKNNKKNSKSYTLAEVLEKPKLNSAAV